jgi:hypothetical protein
MIRAASGGAYNFVDARVLRSEMGDINRVTNDAAPSGIYTRLEELDEDVATDAHLSTLFANANAGMTHAASSSLDAMFRAFVTRDATRAPITSSATTQQTDAESAIAFVRMLEVLRTTSFVDVTCGCLVGLCRSRPARNECTPRRDTAASHTGARVRL